MQNIIVLDDEQEIADLLEVYLANEGYQVFKFYRAEGVLDCIQENEISLAILDVMLPDIDGFQLCRQIRENWYFPIIMLTAKIEDVDKITGLTVGADDYITKPFSLALVKMHMEAVLKRAGKLRTMVEYKELQADVNAQLLYYKEQHIPTTRKEFDLMVYFMEHPGIVLPRDTILNAVWEYDYVGDVRTIDTLVKQLRKKLGVECSYIRTVYGVGYIFGEEGYDEKL